ncbi:putative transposase, Ptta/En/Spm, plant [Helianthus anomalus]
MMSKFYIFNDHDKVSQTIGSNLKSMWSGPWKGWKDVPSHHRECLFERFQSSIHSCWEKCIKGKFPDLLKRDRDKAKALAIQEGAEVENDLTPFLPFKPLWMSQESWETLVHAWNTVSWKNKASQNSDNRGKVTGGRHTLGSKSFLTVRKNMVRNVNLSSLKHTMMSINRADPKKTDT